MDSRDPPHIAVKKLIMDQQARNSAIFSIPLINLGANSPSGSTGITLNGQRLVSHNNFKAFQ
jgi:hypothetical protein